MQRTNVAWNMQTSRSTGRTYYYNRETKQSTYVRPAGFVENPARAAGARAEQQPAARSRTQLPPPPASVPAPVQRTLGPVRYTAPRGANADVVVGMGMLFRKRYEASHTDGRPAITCHASTPNARCARHHRHTLTKLSRPHDTRLPCSAHSLRCPSLPPARFQVAGAGYELPVIERCFAATRAEPDGALMRMKRATNTTRSQLDHKVQSYPCLLCLLCVIRCACLALHGAARPQCAQRRLSHSPIMCAARA